MPRYIDAELAERKMIELEENDIDFYGGVKIPEGFDGERAVEALRGIPTADVQEVKHGKWTFDNHACGYYYSGVVCSVCRNGEERKSPYCPICGAKMDGKGDDNV